MTAGTLPTGSVFRRRFIAIVSVCGTSTAIVVIAYLVALLRLPRDQVVLLAWVVVGISLPATPISAWVNSKTIAPIAHWLDCRRSEEGATPEEVRAAFERVANLPRRVLAQGFVFFALPALAAVVAMWIGSSDFRLYSAVLMTVAILSAALIGAIIEGYLLKRWIRPLKKILTREVEDPEERASLTIGISLVTKIQVVIASCTIVPVLFVVFMAHTRSAIPIERLAGALQTEILEEGTQVHAEGGAAGLESLENESRGGAFPVRLMIFDRENGKFLRGDVSILGTNDVARLRVRGNDAGRGQSLQSDNLVSWRPIEDSSLLLVAVSSRGQLMGERVTLMWVFGGLLFGCLLMALGVGWLVADDVGGATRRLGRAADRMREGDLRRIDVIESEDELGTLGRAFEVMSTSLRSSLGEVAGAADGVESAAFEIAQTAEGLADAAAEQGREVKQAVSATGELGAQISGISGSSRELNELVDESTSSLLELGSSGEQLNQTAGVLSTRVEEVSTSVEQMVRSVREIALNTETLSEAASDASSNMEEIASSMRLVDDTAVQTSELSQQAVEAAERGQQKVRSTIEGMESIRVATDVAQKVILSLGDRTQAIGGILDVIDNVADETNLLALNAAIIAAQAGEHGRAFSVVADEIKELADRVLASTKEIGGLIGSLQEESRSAIQAIDQGSQSVADGVTRSTEAGEALDQITRISREGGLRIREIVSSVTEQTRAAGHVVELMDRVREGVMAIRTAAGEQERGNEVVWNSTQAMRELAQQLHTTTSEQSRGLSHIGESVEGVREAMESINTSLEGQSAACNQVVGFLEEVSSRGMASETSATGMGDSSRGLLEQAQKLRDTVSRFQG